MPLPEAVDDTFGMNENTQLTGSLLGNDDLGDEATTVTAFDSASVNGGAVTSGCGRATFTYTPTTDFVGSDTFTYTITDADGDTSTATVTVNTANVNQLPNAVDDTFGMDENTQLTGTLLGNDDLGDEATTVTAFDNTSVNGGTVSVDAQGNFTYTPVTDFVGSDTFTYTITDVDGDTSTATVTINIANVNQLPNAVDDTFGMDENTQLTGTLLGNDDLGDEATTVTAFDNTSVNGGTVSVDAQGNFTYTPVTDFVGSDTFTYTITDVDGDTSTATVTVNVANVNLLPDAVDDSFNVNENTFLNASLMGNDSLGDNPTTVTNFDSTSTNGGSVNVNPNGTFSYSPAPNFVGTDTFTYTITDVDGDSDIATVTVTVNEVENLLPDAVDDSFNVNENMSLNGSLLGNDDLGDNPTTVTDFDSVSVNGGVVSVDAAGNFTYTPANNFVGSDTFTYTITDVDGDTSSATVTVNVANVNIPPVAEDDSFSVAEGATVSGNVITHNDGDGVVDTDGGDGATLTVTQVNGVDLVFDGVTGEATVAIKDGTLLIKEDGSFTYTHNGNDPVGVSPSFAYTLSDGADVDTGNVTIAVTPVNDPPVAADDSFSVAEGATVAGNVITHNDGDGVVDTDGGDGATLTVTQVNGVDLVFDGVTGEATVAIKDGFILIQADGSFSYTHNGNDPVGAAPSFEYTLSDGTDVDTGNVTIAVTPVTNIPPVAEDDSFSVAEGATVSGNVITHNDGDGVVDTDGGDGATLTVTQVNGVDLVFDGVTGEATVAIKDGTLLIKEDGSFTYTHNGNDPVGVSPSFAYTLSDGADVDTGNVTIAVTPVNDPPVAADDSFSVAEGATVAGNVITHNDGDGVVDTDGGDGATLTVTQVNGVDLVFDGVTGEATVAIKDGFILIQADGSFSYTHNGNDPVGAAPSFEYTLSDGTDVDTGNVTIAVTPVTNIPPVAADDSFSVVEGATVAGNVITHNDGDGVVDTDGGDGATLTVTQVNGVDLVFDGVTGEATVAIKDGFILIQADGSFSYTHNGNDPVGAAPSFAYTLSDGADVDTGNVTIAVTPVNDPPVAADDSFSVAEGATVAGNVITHNDGDGVVDTDGGDGATLTVTQVNGVDLVFDGVTGEATVAIKDGFILIQADGSFSYTHNGNDPVGAAPSFAYTLSDGADVDTGNVTIAVTPVNDPPVAADDSFSVAEGATVAGNVITHNDGDGVVDTDGGDGATLTVTQVNGVDLVFDGVTGEATVAIKDGFILIQADGSFSYTHNGNDPVGAAPSFEYTLSDGTDVDTGNVTIAVTPVTNIPPVAADDSFSVAEGATVAGNVITHNDGDGVVDTDGGDGATLTVTQVNGVDLVFDGVTGEATVAIKDGTLLIKEDGSFSYNNDGFVLGSAPPSFEYTLSDGTDSDIGAVTINVLDNAPDAIDDLNYIQLVEIGDTDTANRNGVKGNVISGGSSGDNADTSVDGFGTPVITQVVFDGNTYLFSDTVSSHSIDSGFGTLTIDSSGAYSFVTPPGMAMPSADVNLTFAYTIQDGDLISPEEDTADLTINIKPASSTAQSHDLDVDFYQTSATIDTTFEAKVPLHASKQAFKYSLDSEDLSDILTDSNTDGLESYLAVMDEDESAIANIDLATMLKESLVEEVALGKGQNDLEQSSFTTVTNGLLEGGGTIISEQAAANNAPIAEFDSAELL